MSSEQEIAESESAKKWVAVVTRSDREKTVSHQLAARGYETFLPTYPEERQWSDRVKVVDKPLFPGYVFGRVDIRQRLPVLTAPGVITIVGDRSGPCTIEVGEIEAIRKLVASDLKYERWPFCKAGETVEIQSGPLAGVTGIFVETKSAGRVVLTVELLQRSVAVELPREHVKPVRSYRFVSSASTYNGQAVPA